MDMKNFPAIGVFNRDLTTSADARVVGWTSVNNLQKMSYACGFCRNFISNDKGYTLVGMVAQRQIAIAYIHICHICHNPTYFDPNGLQFPAGSVGKRFDHAPSDVLDMYEQALRCLRADCLEATVMVCRRLLMALAYSLNAEEGKTFQYYVEYFVTCGAITTPMKPWVDKIREIGNFATHKMPKITQEQAENVVRFVEVVFDNVFEAPGKAGIATPFVWRVSTVDQS